MIGIIDELVDTIQPHLAFGNNEYAVIWGECSGKEILFSRADISGAKIGSDTRLASFLETATSPKVAFRDSEYGLVWHDYLNVGEVIYFTRLSSLGNHLGGNVQITADSYFSLFPVIVSKGNEYALAWYDSRHGDWEIYFASIGCNW